MSNLLNIGASGLNAAQVALTTVGNNISNVNTTGYSRQTVVQTEAIAQSAGNYTIGSGVDIQSVQRAYSDFLTTALWSSNSSMSRASSYNDLATTLNSALSASGNLQGALDSFYAGFSTVANTPGVASSRQSLLGNASQLVTTFNTLGQQLTAQQSQVNAQIKTTVNSINTVASNLANINQQIHAAGNNVHSIASVLFTKYLFVFELTSALLIVAAVGAMVLAHIERDEPKPTQKQLARERIRAGRPQPLPGPGVLSSGNSIGTPALLPDGSISTESVMASTPGGIEPSAGPHHDRRLEELEGQQ